MPTDEQRRAWAREAAAVDADLENTVEGMRISVLTHDMFPGVQFGKFSIGQHFIAMKEYYRQKIVNQNGNRDF